MKIGVIGLGGRMGGMLASEIAAAGHTLSGGTERPRPGRPAHPAAVPDLRTLASQSDAVVDFTHADATARHAAILAEAGAIWVLGTSGLTAEDEAAVERAAERIPVMHAPSFAPGVAMLLALAERLGAALPEEAYDAEIIEMHHRQKVDSPSGTALGLGRAVATGRGVRLEDVLVSGRDGHTGERPVGAIGISAMRGGQVVGEHTLLFAAAGEHIALSHRAFDRRVFAAGAIRAAEWTAGRSPGLYSMMNVLGLRA